MNKINDMYEKAIARDFRWQVIVLWFALLGIVGTNRYDNFQTWLSMCVSLFGGKSNETGFLQWYPIIYFVICLYAIWVSLRKLELRSFCLQKLKDKLKPESPCDGGAQLNDCAFLLGLDVFSVYHKRFLRYGSWAGLGRQWLTRFAPLIMYIVVYWNVTKDKDLDHAGEFSEKFLQYVGGHLALLAFVMILGIAAFTWDCLSQIRNNDMIRREFVNLR